MIPLFSYICNYITQNMQEITINPRLKGGFGQVSNTVIRDPNISLQQKAVYSYLASYANSVTNDTYVGINKLANECGISQSTIKRILRELEDNNIIRREPRGKGLTHLTILLK